LYRSTFSRVSVSTYMRYKTIERICSNCQNRFLVDRRNRKAKYCSRNCSIIHRALPVRTCMHCGKKFGAHAYHGSRGSQKFCSKDCYTLYMRSRQPRPTCEKCGREFRVHPSQLRYNANRFCSYKCAGNARERFFKACEWCGDDFEFTKHRLTSAHYCSRKCQGQGFSAKKTKHPVNAKTRCGRKAWRERRLEALERDGWQCTRCGRDQKLVVHHIRPWRETQDDSLENLTTLCMKCHGEVEPRVMLNVRKSYRIARLQLALL